MLILIPDFLIISQDQLIVASAQAVDYMLKERGFREGDTLNKRIKAVGHTSISIESIYPTTFTFVTGRKSQQALKKRNPTGLNHRSSLEPQFFESILMGAN